MLFIFRKIRRSFFLPGKVRTYLAYAAGEILLIVVGILLALQISNWNEGLKERQEETIILQGLRSEFQGYIREFKNGKTNSFEPMISAMETILQSMDAGHWSSEELSIDRAVNRIRFPPTTSTGHGIRDTIAQGGRMEIISNRTLRELLARWPHYHQELLDDQEIGRKMVLESLDPYLVSQGIDLSSVLKYSSEWPVERKSIASYPESVDRILNDPKFKTLIQLRYAMWNHAGSEYDQAIEAAEEILDLIDAELQERGALPPSTSH